MDTPQMETSQCYETWLKLLIDPTTLKDFELTDKFALEYLLNLALGDGIRIFLSDLDQNSKNGSGAAGAVNNQQLKQQKSLLLSDANENSFQTRKMNTIRYLSLCFIVLLKYDNKQLIHILNSRQLEVVLMSLLKIYESGSPNSTTPPYPIQIRRYALMQYYRLALTFITKNMMSVKHRYHHVVSIVSLDPQTSAEHEQYLFQRYFGECEMLVDSIEKILLDDQFWVLSSEDVDEKYAYIINKLEFNREIVQKELPLWKKLKTSDMGQNKDEPPRLDPIPDKPIPEKPWKEEFDDYCEKLSDRITQTDEYKLHVSYLEKFNEQNILDESSTDADFDDMNCEFFPLKSKSPMSIFAYSQSVEKIPKLGAIKEFDVDPTYLPIKVLKEDNKSLSEEHFKKIVLHLKKARQLGAMDCYEEGRQFLLAIKNEKKIILSTLFLESVDHEILKFDIRHFRLNQNEEEFVLSNCDQLRKRCLEFLTALDDYRYDKHRDLVEACCHFLMDFGEENMKELRKVRFPIVRFSACLCHPLVQSDQRDKCLEVWNVALGYLSAVKPQGHRSNLTQSQTEYYAFIDFLKQISNLKYRMHIATLFAKFYNILRNNSMSGSINFNQSYPFPETIVSSYKKNIDIREFSLLFNELIRHYLNEHYNATFLQMYGEYLVAEDVRNCDQAFQYFLRVMYIKTSCFNSSDFENFDDLITQLINCSSKAKYHYRAAILYQFQAARNVNCYGMAFQEMSQEMSNDSLGDYLDSVWDITYLEWLHSNPRFENHFGQKILNMLRLPELNENNPTDIRKHVIASRARFFFHKLLDSSTL